VSGTSGRGTAYTVTGTTAVTGMITLIELDHTLRRAEAIALTTRPASPARSRELQEGLKGLAWMLSEDIQVRTATDKEACRQLRIETTALLAELQNAQRDPTAANQGAVDHRMRAWTALLQRVRLTLGLAATADRRRHTYSPTANTSGR
jgi:hypothetical protein